MGRPLAAGFTLGLGSAVAFLLGHPGIGAMAGLCSVCIIAALVADSIWPARKFRASEGFFGKLEEDTRVEAHRGEFVVIHPARPDYSKREVSDLLKRIGRAPVYLDEKKMSAQEVKELHDRITRKDEED